MAEKFGCCSKRIECSDAGACFYKNDPEMSECGYRRNLEAGRIFYGKNAGKKVTKAVDNVTISTKKVTEYKIYLTCYDRPFAVLYRHDIYKGAVSYQLKEDNFNKIKNLFDGLEIPYITDITQVRFKSTCKECKHYYYEDEIDYCSVQNNKIDTLETCTKYKEKEMICDSRTVIEVGEDVYHILNFDSLLIPDSVAEGIKKAFEAKGVPARVEKYGRCSKIEIPPYKVGMKEAKVTDPLREKEQKVEKAEVNKPFEQFSIFELLGV